MKKFALFFVSCLITVALQAQNTQMPGGVSITSINIVEKEQARIVANNFLTERILNQQCVGSVDALSVADVTTLKVNDLPALYVFSNHGEGFVIVSADYALTPILGYSYVGIFPEKGASGNFDSFLETYLDQVEWVRKQPFSVTPDIRALWQKYLSGEVDCSRGATSDVAPFLTCLWSQDPIYSVFCPEDPLGFGGYAAPGCVAVAMSMIMYYYRYPLQGTGVHTYTPPHYQTQTVDYGATWYDWDGMLDQINDSSGQSIPAVAQLIYHAGVSVFMQYGTYESSTGPENVPSAIKQHFGYSPSAQFILKNSYTNEDWENMVVGELDSLKPVFYKGGVPGDGGHAFVSDGYQVTGSLKMFHFNMGWGGFGNGYYTLANPNGFLMDQGMIRNFIPAAGYPYGCSSHVITDANGSFEDGSSPRSNYSPNSNCTWLIDPADSVNTISISFTAFNVDVSDTVFIYDGENEISALLGTFTGASIPPTVSSTGSKLFLKFKTDGSSESKGWVAEYHSVYPVFCSGLLTLTEPQGSFSDGSGTNMYNNNSHCMWEIQQPDSSYLFLSFNDFDLEKHDTLMLYSIGDSSTLIGSYHGSEFPDPVISLKGDLQIIFKSNGYNTANGFDANYSFSSAGTDKSAILPGLTLSPNPAKEYIELRLINSQALDIVLSVSDMTGQQLYSERIESIKGNLEKTICLSNYEPGMYLVKLKTNKGYIVRKLIVVQ